MSSEFHRELRNEPESNARNDTNSFSSFNASESYPAEQTPVLYQYSASKIPQPKTSPVRHSPRRDNSPRRVYQTFEPQQPVQPQAHFRSNDEYDQLKALYSASQRRVQDLNAQIETMKYENDESNRDLRHQISMECDRADNAEAKVKDMRSQLEQGEQRIFDLSKKLTSFQTANQNFGSQNKEFEKQIVVQMAQIESLENELRIAHSDDAIQKANLANQRKLDESRKQHRLETDQLKVTKLKMKT